MDCCLRNNTHGKALKKKFLLMLQAEGIEKHCFQVHFVDTSKNFQVLFKKLSAIIIVILSKESQTKAWTHMRCRGTQINPVRRLVKVPLFPVPLNFFSYEKCQALFAFSKKGI